MPLVEITLVAGRSPERVRAVIHEVHEGVRRALDVPADSIRVVVREVAATHFAAGDVTLAERRARHAHIDGAGSPRDTAAGTPTP